MKARHVIATSVGVVVVVAAAAVVNLVLILAFVPVCVLVLLVLFAPVSPMHLCYVCRWMQMVNFQIASCI